MVNYTCQRCGRENRGCTPRSCLEYGEAKAKRKWGSDDWAMACIVVAVLVLIAFNAWGCVPTEKRSTLEQTQRETVAGKANADVIRETLTTPPEVKVETKDGVVTVTQPAAVQETVKATTSASENSDSAAAGRTEESVTIPLFVKLIGAAVGVLLVVGVIWAVRRMFKAVDVAFEEGDKLAAGLIHRVRTEAIRASGDEATRLSTLAGDMERDRTNWHREP